MFTTSRYIFWFSPVRSSKGCLAVEATSRRSVCNPSNSRVQVPFFDHRSNRLNTVFHGPNSAGRSRHGTPVRRHHKTASTNIRLSFPRRPGPRLSARTAAIFAHFRSSNGSRTIDSPWSTRAIQWKAIFHLPGTGTGGPEIGTDPSRWKSKRHPAHARLVGGDARHATGANLWRKAAPELAVVVRPTGPGGRVRSANPGNTRFVDPTFAVEHAATGARWHALAPAIAFATCRTTARTQMHASADLTFSALIVAKAARSVVAGFTTALSAKSARAIAVILTAGEATQIGDDPLRYVAVRLEVLTTAIARARVVATIGGARAAGSTRLRELGRASGGPAAACLLGPAPRKANIVGAAALAGRGAHMAARACKRARAVVLARLTGRPATGA